MSKICHKCTSKFYGKTCGVCESQYNESNNIFKPIVYAEWDCPNCQNQNPSTLLFCERCSYKKPYSRKRKFLDNYHEIRSKYKHPNERLCPAYEFSKPNTSNFQFSSCQSINEPIPSNSNTVNICAPFESNPHQFPSIFAPTLSSSTNNTPVFNSSSSNILRPNTNRDFRPNTNRDFRPNASRDFRSNTKSRDFRPHTSRDFRPNTSREFKPNPTMNLRSNKVDTINFSRSPNKSKNWTCTQCTFKNTRTFNCEACGSNQSL